LEATFIKFLYINWSAMVKIVVLLWKIATRKNVLHTVIPVPAINATTTKTEPKPDKRQKETMRDASYYYYSPAFLR
jgi:hypothetical protein